MQHLEANSHLLCNSCDKELGFIRQNVNVAQFLYCDECVRAEKFHPDHAFLQSWDKDIFLEPFADFSLQGSDGGILRAHKAVLAGKSKVFKTMLRAGMSESVSGKVTITDMTAKELRPLLKFLYTGKVNQRSLECHGVALYRASHKYDLPLLTAMCERFLQFNVFRDVRGVFELAVNYGVQKFQKAVLPFIFSKGFIESNPPPLVLKTVRAVSQFECFAAYRKKKFKEVSFFMELALYRMADYLDDPHKGVEEQNEMVLASTSGVRASNQPKTEEQEQQHDDTQHQHDDDHNEHDLAPNIAYRELVDHIDDASTSESTSGSGSDSDSHGSGSESGSDNDDHETDDDDHVDVETYL